MIRYLNTAIFGLRLNPKKSGGDDKIYKYCNIRFKV